MKYIQSMTPGLEQEVTDRYTKLGWGRGIIRTSNMALMRIQFIWLKDEPPIFPDLSDLGLPSPELQV